MLAQLTEHVFYNYQGCPPSGRANSCFETPTNQIITPFWTCGPCLETGFIHDLGPLDIMPPVLRGVSPGCTGECSLFTQRDFETPLKVLGALRNGFLSDATHDCALVQAGARLLEPI